MITTRRTFVKCALLAGALLVPAHTMAAHATAATYAVPTTIDRSGTTDVTAALDAFIARVPDGGTVTFPSGSRYRIENIVIVNDRHDLTIDGAGATFVATTTGSAVTPTGPNAVRQHWPRHRDHFLVYEGTNVVLKNLTVVGANPNGGTADNAYVASLEAQNGVEFYGTRDGLLQNCAISMTYGDLVYIGQNASGIRVTGCTLTRSGRQGITVSDAENVLIDHDNIARIRRSGIDLETFTASWSVNNAWIAFDTFGPIRLGAIAAGAQGDVSNVLITRNSFVGEPMSVQDTPPLTLTPRRHDWTVTNNTSDTKFGSPVAALRIENTDRVTIEGNYQPLQSGRWPVQVAVCTTGSTSITLTGNEFPYL